MMIETMVGVFSASMFRDMRAMLDQKAKLNSLSVLPPNLWGIPAHSSAAFPFEQACKVCHGTGEGNDSTYCGKCSGAGRNRYEGMIRNGPQTIFLTVALPKAFLPSFPLGLVALPPLSRGLA